MRVLSGQVGLPKLLRDRKARLDGGLMALVGFAGLFDRPEASFEIVRP